MNPEYCLKCKGTGYLKTAQWGSVKSYKPCPDCDGTGLNPIGQSDRAIRAIHGYFLRLEKVKKALRFHR